MTEYFNYHDCSGDGGNSYWPVYGCTWGGKHESGIYHDNDTSTSADSLIGSRLSEVLCFSALTE